MKLCTLFRDFLSIVCYPFCCLILAVMRIQHLFCGIIINHDSLREKKVAMKKNLYRHADMYACAIDGKFLRQLARRREKLEVCLRARARKTNAINFIVVISRKHFDMYRREFVACIEKSGNKLSTI